MKPNILQFCFDLLENIASKTEVSFYEAFIMGYTSGKYGVCSFQNNCSLYEKIAALRKKKASDKELFKVYVELSKDHVVFAEEMINEMETNVLAKKLEKKKVNCSKEINNQFQLNLGARKKESMELARKLAKEQEREEEQRRKVEEKKTSCELCRHPVDFEELCILDNCDCQFHIDCAKNYILQQMRENAIPIPCPLCGDEMVYSDLQPLLGKADLERYDSLFIQRELNNNPEAYSYCPTTNCAYVFVWDKKDSDRFECPMCSKEYCLSCRCLYHKNLTCVQYQSRQSCRPRGHLAFKLGTKEKICPVCNEWTTQGRGNRYVSCCHCRVKFCPRCGERKGKCVCPSCWNSAVRFKKHRSVNKKCLIHLFAWCSVALL
eukprot:TRINITY_DN7056_c0_g6_i1.p1 TRINITY_DN7056_c0_g6~~TRINITY_DN7056_c0_g6_i1.p1  ORF type:complete len:377 (-),score=74.14 TRINITY_DN7056_c0_g6_i1:90-1220(-)